MTSPRPRKTQPIGRRVAALGATSFRIGRLAELSGFAPIVLRAWERRYKLLDPVRTDNGYRLYTMRDLSVLSRVRELIDEGNRIGDIARMGRDALAPEAPAKLRASPAADTDYFDGRLEIAWSVLDALPCAVIVTDTRGLVRWVNRGVPLLCGYDLADLHGRSPGSILQGPGSNRNAVSRLRAAISDCRTCSVRILNYHRSGEAYMAQLDVAPLGFGANHVGFVGMARRIETRGERLAPRTPANARAKAADTSPARSSRRSKKTA